MFNYFRLRVNKPKWINFGEWSDKIDYINTYNNLADRLIYFFKEVGKDPYNRYYNIENLISFAIDTNNTDKDIDYIYRHYVYNILSKIENVDIKEEEIKNIINEFIIIENNLN